MDLHANMGTFCAIVDPWRVGWRTPIDFFPCSATSFQKHQLERPLSSPCSRAERFCGSSFAQAEHRHTLHSVKRLLFHSRSGKPPTAATISLEPTWSPSLFLYAAYLKAHRHNTITNSEPINMQPEHPSSCPEPGGLHTKVEADRNYHSH